MPVGVVTWYGRFINATNDVHDKCEYITQLQSYKEPPSGLKRKPNTNKRTNHPLNPRH